MNNEERINEEKEELGSWTKEILRPENLHGPFNTVEEAIEDLLNND